MTQAGGKSGWSLRRLGMNEMVVGLRYANPIYGIVTTGLLPIRRSA